MEPGCTLTAAYDIIPYVSVLLTSSLPLTRAYSTPSDVAEVPPLGNRLAIVKPRDTQAEPRGQRYLTCYARAAVVGDRVAARHLPKPRGEYGRSCNAREAATAAQPE